MAKLKLPLPKPVMDKLLEAIADGLTYDEACRISGVPRTTFFAWKQKGEKGTRKIYKDFVDQLKKAQAEGILSRIKRIKKHGEKDWKADAWWLERCHPERFARREFNVNTNEHTFILPGIKEKLENMDDEKLGKLDDIISDIAGE